MTCEVLENQTWREVSKTSKENRRWSTKEWESNWNHFSEMPCAMRQWSKCLKISEEKQFSN